jgi:hypothetical protein
MAKNILSKPQRKAPQNPTFQPGAHKAIAQARCNLGSVIQQIDALDTFLAALEAREDDNSDLATGFAYLLRGTKAQAEGVHKAMGAALGYEKGGEQ